jgi:hypothetical protein
MATSGFPALDIRPPESPIQQLSGVMQLKSAVQQTQMGEIQLQQARKAQQSQQVLMSLYAKNNGDLNQTYADAVASGQVTPEHLMQFRTQSIAAQTQLATLDEKKLANLQKTHDMAADALEAVKGVPVEQRGDEIKRQFGILVSQGVDPKQLLPAINGLPDFSDDSINRLETTFKGSQWMIANEYAEREKQADIASKIGAGQRGQAAMGELALKQKQEAESDQGLISAAAGGDKAAQAALDFKTNYEARKAGTAAGAEAQARQPFELQLAKVREEVAQTFQTNKDATDKIEANVLKPYEDKMTSIGQLQSAVEQTAKGNVTAARAVALKLIGVTNPEGTKRYNEAEAERMISQGNVPERVKATVKNLLTGDNWTDKMARDMMEFGNGQASVAKENLNRGIDNVNRLYKTNVGQGLKADQGPTARTLGGPPAGATMKVPGSDGKLHWSDGKRDLGIVQ